MDYDTLLVERDHASKSFQNAMDCGALPAPGVKCQLVQGGAASGNPETDRPFDDSLAPGAESHVFLARAARPVASDEAARPRRRGAAQVPAGRRGAAAPHAAVLVLLMSVGLVITFTHADSSTYDVRSGTPARRGARFLGASSRARTLSRARGRARRGTGGDTVL